MNAVIAQRVEQLKTCDGVERIDLIQLSDEGNIALALLWSTADECLLIIIDALRLADIP